MKSYTNLEQSRKLAEILPIESADMSWTQIYDENHMMSDYRLDLLPYRFSSRISIPAWSLAALLNIIPFVTIMKDEEGWYGECEGGTISSWNIEAIDTCYEMIIKLHEQKIL